MTEANYRAVVEYDGTNYHGFQVQRDRQTIQGELERALASVTRQPIRIAGSGRTDAGVHAKGQVISFRSDWGHGEADLERAINAVVTSDIAVRDLGRAHSAFHARFSARRRSYLYCIYHSDVRSPLMDRYAYYVPDPVDVEEMNRAAGVLVGEKDYAALGQPPTGTNCVRTIWRAQWTSDRGSWWQGGSAKTLLFEIEGNAFLRTMVRRAVGCLLAVGRGWLTASDFCGIIDSKEIGRAMPPAPARGLCLWRVDY